MKTKSTKQPKKPVKKADPKFPPDHEPDDFDPDEEESWPDVEPLIRKKAIKR